MKFLRAVKGVTRRDRIRNEQIREELEVESIHSVIERNQLKWFGHINRMQQKRQVKQVWEAKVQNKRGKGRPKKTWNGEVAMILKKRNKNWTEATRMTGNKGEWKKFVHKIGYT